MHPLRLAAYVLFESKQSAHNYARAAGEILHRNIDFIEVPEKFGSGELDLRILGASYDKRVRSESGVNEQSAVVPEAMPLHDEVDDVVVSGDDPAKGGGVDTAADSGSDSALPVSLDLTAPGQGPEVKSETAMPDKFMADAKAEIAQIKLSVNPALMRIAPLKVGQRYIAEFTLEQDDAGIVTALRTARSQFKFTTTKVHRQRS